MVIKLPYPVSRCAPLALLSNTRKTELPSAAVTRVFLARLVARTAPFALLSLLFLAPALAESAGGIQWTPPSTWKAQPQRPMRAATYSIPAAAGEEDAECAVFYFGPGQGGGVDENMRRWLAQFEGGAAVTPKTQKQSVNGLNVTTVQHSGTYLSGAPMAPVKTPKPGYRLIGSIVEAPNGNVFFKLTGPARTFAAALPAFEKMIATLKK